MKMRLLGALVALAISFALPTFGQQKETVDPKILEQLDALLKKFDEAFNNNDAAAVAALFTEDAIWVVDTGPLYGRQLMNPRTASLSNSRAIGQILWFVRAMLGRSGCRPLW